MSNGFYGWTMDGSTKLVSISDDADPARFVRILLPHLLEMVPSISRPLVRSLRLVDEDDVVGEYVEHLRGVGKTAFPNEKWEAVFARQPSGLSAPLVLGFAPDASLYGDAAWGYVINFDDNSIEVYRAALEGPKNYRGQVLCDNCYLLVSYYLDNLPSLEVFLEGIAEEVSA